MMLSEQQLATVVDQLVTRHGAAARPRADRGVRQAAALWRAEDGSVEAFGEFCATQFVPAGPELDVLFARFEQLSEQISGHFNALTLALRQAMDEDTGPLLPADRLFAEYSPDAHLNDDLFQTKLAFIVLLNFPVTTLQQRLELGGSWDRRTWAEARLAGGFTNRVPAAVTQQVTAAYTAADSYIYEYNLFLDHVLGRDGKPLYGQPKKLISHWGLRDELKTLYVDPAANLPRQEAIQQVMERIVAQEIPAVMVNGSSQTWDPFANTIDGRPAEREPDTRYARLLGIFNAHRAEDPYFPLEPTHIARRFERNREIPEAQFEALLVSVLQAPVAEPVARLIAQRLGRPLRPFDIWYDGFKPRGSISEAKLDEAVRRRYPDLAAFQQGLPALLGQLGFDKPTATFLAERIEVDPARGAGHAWGAQMRTDKAHLRTRVPAGGMDYKGFNVAMHELGHTVEQTFSLYRVDHTLLEGVPNTAFTEGFAFVFQGKDLEVLGLSHKDARQAALTALDAFWATREIAGVALVDMRVWHWLYDHPQASPSELRTATLQLAREVWNRYNAPLFGVQDSPLLAVYSHMINSGLYLPDYPLGHIIAFQIEDYFEHHPLGQEMERLCRLGSITPEAWMKQAVGQGISVAPLLAAAEQGVAQIAAAARPVPPAHK